MKTVVRSVLVACLMMIAAPAFSSSVMEIIKCKKFEDASEAAIEAAAADLLKAIRSMEGGEEIHAHLQFPLVAHMGEYDFWVVVVTPSVELWGKFMDEHADSDAVVEAEEKLFKLAVCPDNALFETVDLR